MIATLAWNLKSRFALMMHRKADRRRYVAMEFRTFIREMILLPRHIIPRVRWTTLRIIGWQTGCSASGAPSSEPASDNSTAPNASA